MEPILLLSTLFPSMVSISKSILHTVVLPLVPVTAMIFSGLSAYFKNCGQILSASTPGKLVPLCLVIFRAAIDSLAAHRAIKYLMGHVMKETKGKANPKMLNEMFLEELKK